MRLETFSYRNDTGWSVRTFPDLDSPRTLVLCFGATEYLDHPEPLQQLAAAYPRSHVLGCSSSGEIHGAEIADGTLVVAVAAFASATLAHATVDIAAPTDSRAAGRRLGESLAGASLRAVLIFSDGIHVNGSELVRGINEVLPASVVVTGGLAGDGDRFRQTWVLRDGQPKWGAISAVGLSGESVLVSHGSRGGWDPFGPERMVTRSQGNVLYELDGEPALQLYKRYLGERAAGLPATGLLFPLALRHALGDDCTLIRTILGIDEAAQSMTFAGDIPQGSLVRLMKANFDRLVGGAFEAAHQARSSLSGAEKHILSIAISCVGRRLVLGARSEEETEAILEVLPAGTQQIGFYSYGEISPYVSGACDLHNQTMTLTVISER